MTNPKDALTTARLRQLKREEARLKAEQREKDNAARIRKLERELETRQAFLIGSTIRDAELTEDEKRVIAGILNRRPDKPADFYKVERYMDVGSAAQASPELPPGDAATDEAYLGDFKPSRSDMKQDRPTG